LEYGLIIDEKCIVAVAYMGEERHTY